MIIIGVDYHPSSQRIAFLDQDNQCAVNRQGDKADHISGLETGGPTGGISPVKSAFHQQLNRHC